MRREEFTTDLTTWGISVIINSQWGVTLSGFIFLFNKRQACIYLKLTIKLAFKVVLINPWIMFFCTLIWTSFYEIENAVMHLKEVCVIQEIKKKNQKSFCTYRRLFEFKLEENSWFL